ncbi:hypothetical protein AAFF_G00217900 [Aldrovandia affinis]|uniref:Uncharacterized protein n=1 Tax=Aldrovandia affinis TaxID=143900 RepID=A0AAD7SXT1_9TELE|nr:hypothetical protein AAFF_G00217900 [Aldrovandia affinis]
MLTVGLGVAARHGRGFPLTLRKADIVSVLRTSVFGGRPTFRPAVAHVLTAWPVISSVTQRGHRERGPPAAAERRSDDGDRRRNPPESRWSRLRGPDSCPRPFETEARHGQPCCTRHNQGKPPRPTR